MSRHGRHRAGVLSVLSVLVTAATAGIVGFGAFGPSSADGDADALVIAPGSVVTNNRSLDIAHIPPRVELGVLVDRSASGADKTAVYRQLVDEVIAQLSAQSVSLRVGLAGFSDYPVFPYGAPEDVPYRRELALGADPAQWHAATNAVTPSLGGGDGRESQLGAVAAALADAQTIDSQPLGFSPSGAAKFLLVPADHRFHVPGDGTCVDVTGCQGDYPGPPAAEVEASAQAAGVHVIGIATDQPNEDLEHLATATNGVVVI
jgi:hypothetical protein